MKYGVERRKRKGTLTIALLAPLKGQRSLGSAPWFKNQMTRNPKKEGDFLK
jgi:hypothetical protein